MKIKSVLALALLSCTLLFAETMTTEQLMALPFEPIYTIPDFKIEHQNEFKEFILPPMPVKSGKIRALRGRFTSWAKNIAGCNNSMCIEVNTVPLARYTSAGDERMLCKTPSFIFTTSAYAGREFGYFTGIRFNLPFAPSVDELDKNTVGNNGSVLLLDLEDVVIGVDGNAMKITNTRRQLDTPITLICESVEIGYLDKSVIPPPPGVDFTYNGVSGKAENCGVRLEVGKAGGFAVIGNKGDAYVVDTKLAMPFAAPFELLAEDTAAPEGIEVTVETSGRYGFVVRAKWPNGIELYRRLTVEQDGLVHWMDDWKNNSDEIKGIPFHHRIRLAGALHRTIIAGNSDSSNIPSPDVNPTVVILNNKDKDGSGIGVTEENDFARLLGSIKTTVADTEIYTTTLALAPKCSLAMNYSIDAFAKGGYWGFINRQRRRWHIGSVTAPYPFFFGPRYMDAPGENPAEKIKNAFAHLGPIAVGVHPWRRFDHSIVRSNKYAKLPEGAEPAPGKTPDLDIDTFLTFKHREIYDRQLVYEIDLFRKNAPEARYIAPTHPAMETVYLPLADRWPYAENAIHTVTGEIYHHPHYDRSHLGNYVEKGWAIGYYAPYGGTRYYDVLINDIMKVINLGVDGIYIDELSFGLHRDYSRYDYGRWDGFSADLDEKGNVVRLKSDVAYGSEGLQSAAISMTKERGLFFLGNGSAALRSINNSQALRFWEGGNGMATLGYAHLDHVPLVFGNYGNPKTQQGVFSAVREGLTAACIYSPTACNLVLKGRDNFVCKLYPITVVELYPGLIIGRERLITLNSGTFDWPGAPEGAKIELFSYDAEGNRLPNNGEAPVVKDGKVTLAVEKAGLVIAELAKP